MMDEQVIQGIENGNFDLYRTYYPFLSFQELQQIHDKWDTRYPVQNNFEKGQIETAFGKLISKIDHPFTVFEFGFHQGNLAKKLFDKAGGKIKNYVGCDICKSSLDRVNGNLQGRPIELFLLKKQLWRYTDEEYNVRNLDVFISSHTLEHLTTGEIGELLSKIKGIRFLLLELPFDWTLGWEGYVGSHLLKIHPQIFINKLESANYKMLEISSKEVTVNQPITFSFEYAG